MKGRRVVPAIALIVLSSACAGIDRELMSDASPEVTVASAESPGPEASPSSVPRDRGEWRVIADAPLFPRINHVAVWMGEEMVVWGGSALLELEPGDPSEPEGYSYNEATGTQIPLIVEVYRDGAAYDPDSDEWRKLPPMPLETGVARDAVWTGDEMLVWLNDDDRLTGAAYSPRSDSWRVLPPHPYGDTFAYAAAWTGEEMIIASGIDYSGKVPPKGAAYKPSTNEWREIPVASFAPPAWTNAIWAGREMIVWGGTGACEGCPPWSGGFAFDVARESWRRLPTAPIGDRAEFQQQWAGRELIVWGGQSGPYGKADGAAYEPGADRWRRLADGPLAGRSWSTSLWTGERFVVWGGYNGYAPRGQRDVFGDGAAYDPRGDAWVELPAAPLAPRCNHSAVWTGQEMIVWGGTAHCGTYGVPFANGARIEL